MDPVHFLPEGKHCYDVVDEDLEAAEEEPFPESLEIIKTLDDCQLGELLLKAAELGKVEFVNELLNKNKDLIQTRDSDGYTALHRASYNGEVEVMEILISNGADVLARTEDGWQPLHSACRWSEQVRSFAYVSSPHCRVWQRCT